MSNIAFISELPFTGNVARNHPHMRTEFAQFCALKADHHCFYDYDPKLNKNPAATSPFSKVSSS